VFCPKGKIRLSKGRVSGGKNRTIHHKKRGSQGKESLKCRLPKIPDRRRWDKKQPLSVAGLPQPQRKRRECKRG